MGARVGVPIAGRGGTGRGTLAAGVTADAIAWIPVERTGGDGRAVIPAGPTGGIVGMPWVLDEALRTGGTAGRVIVGDGRAGADAAAVVGVWMEGARDVLSGGTTVATGVTNAGVWAGNGGGIGAAGGGAVGRGGGCGRGAACTACVDFEPCTVEGANSSSIELPAPTVITPPQTEQRARTPAEGTFAGSTRKTERHSGQETFNFPPSG